MIWIQNCCTSNNIVESVHTLMQLINMLIG